MRLLPITLAFTLSNAFAVQGVGEYFYGPDMAENIACQIAEDYAQTDAIRNFLGEDYESNTSEVCYNTECILSRDTVATVNGTIKKVNKKQSEKIVEQGKIICRVTIDAEVEKINNNIYFNAWTEQPYFKHGESANFFVTANKVGYVYVFNYHSNRYYNILQKKISQTGVELNLADQKQKIIPRVPEGRYVSKEKMVFVFTELDIKPKQSYNDFEMNSYIRSLPIDKRKIISRVAQIVR